MSTYLLWCDLETTGLDLDEDHIIEAAFILTDANLTYQLAREALLPPACLGWDRLLSNEFVRNMHTANGLVNDIVRAGFRSPEAAGKALRDLDRELVEGITRNIAQDATVYLAGSGVAAFDRPLIDRDFPTVSSLLHYAPIDVGVLKRTWQMWAGVPISDDNDKKPHRAMADVEGHIREARLFRDQFQLAVQS